MKKQQQQKKKKDINVLTALGTDVKACLSPWIMSLLTAVAIIHNPFAICWCEWISCVLDSRDPPLSTSQLFVSPLAGSCVLLPPI